MKILSHFFAHKYPVVVLLILSLRKRYACPVLDNPGRLTELVEKSQAKSTDYQNLESAKEYSDKCVEAAANWAPVADRLWKCSGHCAGCGNHEKKNIYTFESSS